MHFSIDRTVHTTAFDKPVVDHWLERKIAQTAAGSTKKDRSDDRPLQRRARYRLSYIPLFVTDWVLWLLWNLIATCGPLRETFQQSQKPLCDCQIVLVFKRLHCGRSICVTGALWIIGCFQLKYVCRYTVSINKTRMMQSHWIICNHFETDDNQSWMKCWLVNTSSLINHRLDHR